MAIGLAAEEGRHRGPRNALAFGVAHAPNVLRLTANMVVRGFDGLITDKPDFARRVVARRAQMSDPQRLLVALLVRLGARTESLAAEDALRP